MRRSKKTGLVPIVMIGVSIGLLLAGIVLSVGRGGEYIMHRLEFHGRDGEPYDRSCYWCFEEVKNNVDRRIKAWLVDQENIHQ